MRKLPEPQDNLGRVETGTTQFGDDWPGVFIRGDNAMGMVQDIEMALVTMRFVTNDFQGRLIIQGLEQIRDLLKDCRVTPNG